MSSIMEDYETIKSFHDYVDRYVAQRHITVEEALEHQIVKDVCEGQKKENEGKWQGIGG